MPLYDIVKILHLVLLSPSEIIWEFCEVMINVKQGIDKSKVLAVGENGKLNEMIEVSALWSSSKCC